MSDNSSRKFKFISPGVFVNEIDNSEVPREPGEIGPVVIGQSQKGPGMQPVVVESFSEFVEIFGEPVAGNAGRDIWRDRSRVTPTYAAYAAQAWLKNSSPLTFVRLLGEQDPEATASDLDAGGYAGWEAGQLDGANAISPVSGGAWALCMWPSGSLDVSGGAAGVSGTALTGAVAAILYASQGRLLLSGNYLIGKDAAASYVTASACQLMTTDANGNITIAVSRDGTTLDDKVTVSLNPSNPNFIRSVLNTNPAVTNTTITSDSQRSASEGGNFWLGESYERSLNNKGTTSLGVTDKAGGGTANTNYLGSEFYVSLLPMRDQTSTSTTQGDQRFAATKGTTGWFFSQDLSNDHASFATVNMQRLFRCEALTAGEETQQTVKISIANLRAPQGAYENYSTFSVYVRSLTDSDNDPVILERFDNLNLNPASQNYIARVIGDKYQAYDSITKTNREYGQYHNQSRFIRIVMDEDVSRGGADPAFMPFGVYGPLRYRTVKIMSGAAGLGLPLADYNLPTPGVPIYATASAMIDGGSQLTFSGMGGNSNVFNGPAVLMGFTASAKLTVAETGTAACFTGSLEFPSVPLRRLSTWSFPKTSKNVFWGAWTGITNNDTTFNESIYDMIRARCKGLSSNPASTLHDVGLSSLLTGSDPTQIAWTFTMDDISGSAGGTFTYTSGSRQSGLSRTASSSSYKAILDAGQTQFTTLLHGGSTGYNVTERDPFRNSLITETSTDSNSSTLHSLKRAANIVSDAEQVPCNLVMMPGVTNNLATNHLLTIAEERGDTLAIVDLPKVYTADTESSGSEEERNAFTITQAVTDLKGRNINNSYGAAYYPWVLIQDTVTNRTLWAPPSVAALGALSHTDKIAAPWYAPAGFLRGGLSEGKAGIPVLDTSRRLSADDRDDLYAANINPIAKFPAEGIVVFGQKTLQQTTSALDRINVRRLLIYLKREISFIASRLLFAPNTRDTWTRFTQQATPVLDSVKSQFGIEDFRLILDETTTTPDMVDRNIIYAKLIVKPTRSAEFFAIDFVVTNSGASFED